MISSCSYKSIFTEQRDVKGGKTPLHRGFEQIALQLLPTAHLVVQAGHNMAQDHPANRRHDDGSWNRIPIPGLPTFCLVEEKKKLSSYVCFLNKKYYRMYIICRENLRLDKTCTAQKFPLSKNKEKSIIKTLWCSDTICHDGDK